MINLNKHKDGTEKSGFVVDWENVPPRECQNCRWMSNGHCRHEDVINDPEAIEKSLEYLDKHPNDQGWVPIGEYWCCDYYQIRPLVVFFRHGETTANKENKFRGFMDFPLDENGLSEARDSGLCTANLDFGGFYCSDLTRAKQTLVEILKVNKYSDDCFIEYTASARPWNVGEFSGMEKNDENKQLLQAYADNPDIPIPDGESLNEFRAKFTSLFYRAVNRAKKEKKVMGLVAHASDGHEIGNIVYGNIDSLDSDPGGVVIVFEKEGKLEGQVIKGHPTESKKGFGSS